MFHSADLIQKFYKHGVYTTINKVENICPAGQVILTLAYIIII